MGNIPDTVEIENGMREAALKDGSNALCRLLSMLPDYQGTGINCRDCTQPMKLLGKRDKDILSLLGEGKFERGYYECINPDCKSHQTPKDEILDISKTKFSPGVRRLMAKAGNNDAFQKGSVDFREFSGITVTTKEIERVSESIGEEIEVWQTNDQEEILQTIPDANSKEIPIMYIECDGTGVPVISKEVEGRKGKQADGSAKTREAKIGCVFTQTEIDEDGNASRDANSTTYVGAIEDSGNFGKRLDAEAIKRGLYSSDKVVFIGDGAKWIWTIADLYFYGAIKIVDYYHAKEHLHKLIRLLFQEPEKQVLYEEKWVKLFDSGSIETIIEEATSLNIKTGEIKTQVEKELNYFSENADKMRYCLFKEQGLFIGSGVIEAGCKNIIGKRLKQSGMRWSVKGANSIIALRCAIMSGKFNDYWNDRKIAA